MNVLNIVRLAFLASVVALSACRTSKTAESSPVSATDGAFDRQRLLAAVVDAGRRDRQFVTSKVKVRLCVGDQNLSLSGNLRMKRDDVIRLQLVALGFMEAGRIEFTPDYVLVMDRINKQYIKVEYDDVDFLRESGLNFQSLQALFWNELFLPGATEVTDVGLASYEAYPSGTDAAVTLERGALAYRWMADKGSGSIKTTNVTYKDEKHGDTRLTWHYGSFVPMGTKRFPTQNDVAVATPRHTVTLSYTLNGIDDDGSWETRTSVPGRYKEVKIDDILRKLSSL